MLFFHSMSMILLHHISFCDCFVFFIFLFFFFFFKQKTAYEMRISDWSSDVCSSDLVEGPRIQWAIIPLPSVTPISFVIASAAKQSKIGRASCRESVCQYV